MNIEEYRALCQKNDTENYLLDKLIFRKISIYFTILFIKLRISANQATFISLVCSLGSLYFLLYSTTPMLLTAALLIFAYYIIDHVDGELARYYRQNGQMKPSLQGHYFDVLVHRYSSNLMVFFIGLGVYNQYGYELAIWLGILACVGISSFPNVVAAHVIAGKIANNKDVAHNNIHLQKILQQLETKEQQIKDVKSSGIKKIKKIIVESLFFPGHIVILVLVLILDAFGLGFTTLGVIFSFRFLFLLFFAPLYALKTIIQSILWFNKLKHIS